MDKSLLQVCKQKSYPFYQNSLKFVFTNLANKLVFKFQTKPQAPHKQKQTTKPSRDFSFYLRLFLSAIYSLCQFVTAILHMQFPVFSSQLAVSWFYKVYINFTDTLLILKRISWTAMHKKSPKISLPLTQDWINYLTHKVITPILPLLKNPNTPLHVQKSRGR